MSHSGPTVQRGLMRVGRHARWLEIGGRSSAPYERWIVLHGYGQRAGRFLRRFHPIASASRQIVAPEGLSRFYLDDRYDRVGASWLTREDRDDDIIDTHDWLDALVAQLDERDGPPTRTVVLGFSQGAPTAGRWVLDRGVDVDHLVCWGAGMPHDVDLAEVASAAMRLTFVIGRNDPLSPKASIDLELERIRSAEITFELIEFDGGHEIDVETLERIIEAG